MRGEEPAQLGAVATTWEELDPDEYAFTRAVADQMREHDDREQFLDGIDLVLAGITDHRSPHRNDVIPPSPPRS